MLDFGISKFLDNDADRSQAITNIGALTPQYASPEQIRGESISTASDTYSLGVVLFKILTGTFPYDFRNGDFYQQITDTDPTLPSSAAKPDERALVPDPALLKGDLDNIILKAIRRDPSGRYQTVEHLSADISNYLNGFPVEARPATLFYRSQKFFGRHRITLLAAALTVIALLTGLTVALWEADRANRQAEIAENARRQAETEAMRSRQAEERAGKITEFMQKIISYANPGPYAEGLKLGGQAKVIDVMNELSEKIESEFVDRLDIQAELHHKFAEVYTMNERFAEDAGQRRFFGEKGLFHARRALELRKSVYGSDHELVAKDMFYLWANLPGDFDESHARLLDEAIRIMRRTNPNNPNLPEMLSAFANRMHFVGSDDEQAVYFQTARRDSAADPLSLADSYYAEALEIFRNNGQSESFGAIGVECEAALVAAKMKKAVDSNSHYLTCTNALVTETDEARRKLLTGLVKAIRQAIEVKADR